MSLAPAAESLEAAGRVSKKKGVCAEEEEKEGQKKKGCCNRGAGGKNKSKKEKKKEVEEEKGAGLLGKRVKLIGRMKVAGLQVTLLKSQLATRFTLYNDVITDFRHISRCGCCVSCTERAAHGALR